MDIVGSRTLQETVARVRSRVQQLRGRGESIGEHDTKAILIEPVLSALGWRLDELDEVRREYKRKPQDNPVDYALLLFGSPRLFVESKALGFGLDRKTASQVMGYASTVGVGWCVVTNGDEYRIYNAHAALDVDDKLFRSVCLSDPTQESLCLETLALLAKESLRESELESLWKSQFVDRRVKQALGDLFLGDDPGLARLIRKKMPELGLGEIRDSLRRAQLTVQFPEVLTVGPSSQAAVQDEGQKAAEDDRRKSPVVVGVSVHDLIREGLISPPLRLERSYKGVELEATIEPDGKISCQGVSYESLSTAAGMARKSVIGAPEGREYPQTNGWTFWCFRESETGQLLPVDALRQQYLERQR